MFGQIFRYEGLVWRILNCLTDILALSVLWLFCSVPLFTLGASTTALYDAVVRCIRFRQPGTYRRFFRTFRRELLLSSACTLLWGAVAGVGIVLLLSLRSMSSELDSAVVAGAAYYIVLVLPIGACCWIFPLLSRFDFSFSALNRTAFQFALAHLPSTVVLVLLTMELISLSLRYLFPLFFSPVLLMLLWSLFIEPVFQKHGGGISPPSSDPPEPRS